MAKTDNIGSWTSTEFEEFFTNSHRFGGSSETFKKLREQVTELKELDAMPVTKELAEGRRLLLEMIQETSAKYVSEHTGAKSSQGKDRLDVAQALERFCASEIPLMKAEKKVQYFEGKSFADIKKGIDVNELNALSDELKQIQTKKMDTDSVIKYTNTLGKYIPLAEAYLDDESTKRIPAKQEMLRQVNEYKSAISQMRDFRNVKKLVEDGKSWSDLNALREARIVWDQPLEKTGANASERIKLEYNGKKGFFTKEAYDYSHDKFIKEAILKEHDTKDTLTLLNLYDVMIDVADTINVGSQNKTRGSIMQTMHDWVTNEPNRIHKPFVEKMFENEELRETVLKAVDSSWKKTLAEDPMKRGQIVASFQKSLDSLFPISESDKSGLTSEVREFLCQNIDKLNELKNPKALTESESYRLYTEKALLSKKCKYQPGTKEYKAICELESNADLLSRCTDITLNSDKILVARKAANLSSDIIHEYSQRNVASTRIAELLGVGNLLAHSQEMTVIMNGVEHKGCFMEFAEGVDPTSRSGKDFDKLAETEFKRNASYNKAESSLEILDALCGQQDRHARNFFYQLSELQPDGTRTVTGIQGIDNDLAFHLTGDLSLPGRGVREEHMIFIDSNLAKNIQSLTREKLEYVFSDILTKDEINAFESRVEAVKERMKTNMVLIDEDGWDLDEFDESKYKDLSNLDQRTRNYITGLRSYKEHDYGNKIWDTIHKSNYIVSTLREVKQQVKEQQVKTERTAKADDIISKITAMKEGSQPTTKAAEQKAPTRSSFAEMSGTRNSLRNPGFTMGSAAKAAGKKLEADKQAEQQKPVEQQKPERKGFLSGRKSGKF